MFKKDEIKIPEINKENYLFIATFAIFKQNHIQLTKNLN